MATTYEKIQSTTLGSAAANITFSSIPATYTDLRISFYTAPNLTTVSNVFIRYNGDSGSNYSFTRIFGNGSTVSSDASTSQTKIIIGNGALSTTTNPSFYGVDIFSYAGSTFKTCLVDANNDNNGSGVVERTVGLWRDTAAITSITLNLEGGAIDLEPGTTATLYGILKA
jgi:hypothetical protein